MKSVLMVHYAVAEVKLWRGVVVAWMASNDRLSDIHAKADGR
jgi:hypothetical protein